MNNTVKSIFNEKMTEKKKVKFVETVNSAGVHDSLENSQKLRLKKKKSYIQTSLFSPFFIKNESQYYAYI